MPTKSLLSMERLAADLSAFTWLHSIASGFLRDGDLPTLLGKAVEAASSIVGADWAAVVIEERSGDLRLGAHRGFSDSDLERCAGFLAPSREAEARLRRGERVIIEDVVTAPALSSTVDRDAFLAWGVRAIEHVPLRDRTGNFLGFLSTRHRTPGSPSARDLELLEMLARQCAEALERARWAEESAQSNAQAQLSEKLRESELRFRTTVENMPLNLALFDRSNRVLYMNPALAAACAATCGVSPDDIVGKNAEEIWPEQVWTPLRAHAEKAVETRERQSYELEVTLPGRPTAVRQWMVVPLAGPNGDVTEILAMSHDITAQRRLLYELREADGRKSEFIAVLSHELRNPLAAIQTGLYVLERKAPEGDSDERARRIIGRQVGQLVRIVDDLLDVSRITQNKIQIKPQRLDLNELVRLTISDNRAHLERGGVRLNETLADHPIYVDADGARMAQVITNLLSNAVKFTPAGGTARVTVTTDGARAVLSVADTGVGIEPPLLERLFQPFAQADRAQDLSRGGLGLGLSLVKGLVDLHRGSVSARSDGKDQGTEITVYLPLATEGGELAAESDDDASAEGIRVLIIEDEQDVASSLLLALSDEHYSVEVAANGPDGIARAIAFRPDVVFCDIGLPGMDGYEVAMHLRSHPELASTHLVALTGYAQAEDVERARSAGFDEHLAKPPSIERIKEILSSKKGR